jgi:dihydrofolate reductase
MPNVIYSMGVSLDGFVTAPDGEIDWTEPDEELHRFHNERVQELGAQLCGRRLYEEMLYWETADREPGAADYTVEFAGIWQRLPKVVFSTTLEAVEGNTRLAESGIAEEVAQLKEQSGGDIGVGGAGLAASLIELGLVDEFQPFVYPVVVGGGTPFLPPVAQRLELELLETRTFGSRVVHSRYARR